MGYSRAQPRAEKLLVFVSCSARLLKLQVPIPVRLCSELALEGREAVGGEGGREGGRERFVVL